MKKYFLIKLLIFSSFLNGFARWNSPALPHQNTQKKPNFIIILADDLGYGDIGCYGNKRILTPTLDQMAKEGIRFTDFHSNGAVCSPTRAALMTGKYQQRTGINGVITAKGHRDSGLALNENTIAEVLREAGYSTGIFGKWHLGYPEKFNPVHQGFDEFSGYISGNIDYHSHVDQEGYADWWKAGTLTPEEGYSTDLITQNANNFISRHQSEPFFLYIAHEAPHYPYQDRNSRADRSPGGKNGIDFRPHGSEKNPSAIYKTMIEIMDEDIGSVLNTLKNYGLYENTVVIFFSDNGAPQIGNNGKLRGFKGSVWEGGHRVPAIIQWPGHIPEGVLSNETVLSMDLFPTILKLAGINYSKAIDGVSIDAHLVHDEPLHSRMVFWQHAQEYAVRDGIWKLVIPGKEKKPELYNLELDIEEKNNIAGNYPEIVKKLSLKLEQWIIEVNKDVKKIS
ncbi:sulfatase-like hydrolase/transferase [Maribellus comscasis]|uniref:Sulfatase-like hydrolase/transferase n=1 Tax=Maribellus comscasis TaxID=2681766 RepID=A0A6I6K1B6_9BACT|nr:sulfatase-like hydrolase/transferase [Maribellus comscasis]QGY46212.1 sulfatase-like hydrolase/transferase [Maribellus comscasis]